MTRTKEGPTSAKMEFQSHPVILLQPGELTVRLQAGKILPLPQSCSPPYSEVKSLTARSVLPASQPETGKQMR